MIICGGYYIYLYSSVPLHAATIFLASMNPGSVAAPRSIELNLYEVRIASQITYTTPVHTHFPSLPPVIRAAAIFLASTNLGSTAVLQTTGKWGNEPRLEEARDIAVALVSGVMRGTEPQFVEARV